MKLLLYIFLFITSVQFTSQCSNEVTNSMYQFSIKLLRNVAENREHFVIAPTSAWVNLVLISNGATGDTLRELETIQQTKKKCKYKFYKKLMSRIKIEAYNFQSLRVAAVVVDRNMSHDFIGKVRFNYGALVIDARNEDIEEDVKAANSIISTATRGIVQKSITFDFMSQESIRVLDVNYINAVLEIPLNFDSFHWIDFDDEHGKFIAKVKVMKKTDSFGLTSLDVGYITIEVPVGNMSLLIHLPKKGVKIKTVIEKLGTIRLSDIFKALNTSKVQKMTLQLPSIKMRTEISLNQHLEELGISRMFQSEMSEFANMGHGRYHISAMNQYSEFELNEEFSDSNSTISGRNAPTVTVNRPFVFMLVERVSKVVVYTGVYSNPSFS